jgi:hypothetical protein
MLIKMFALEKKNLEEILIIQSIFTHGKELSRKNGFKELLQQA